MPVAVSGLMFWAGCSSDSDDDNDGGSQVLTTGVFGTVRALSGQPINGAIVEVAGAHATTNADGAFSVVVPVGDAVVRAEATGHAPGFARVTVVDGQPTAAHVTLLSAGGPYPLDAAAGGAVSGVRGAAIEVSAVQGQELVALESFGLMDITIRQNGEKLQLADGQQMEISIPLPTNVDDAPPTMPLWSFDEERALWISEGTMTLDADAGTYVANISHMSW